MAAADGLALDPPPPEDKDAENFKFIIDHTAIGTSSLAPDIRLYLATGITPLWHASESFLSALNLPPPFWAFAWPGSELLARHVADHPEIVANKLVLDFAAGGGLAAIAAARAGAADVTACDIDELALAAIKLNAELNQVRVKTLAGDITMQPCRWDVILCGDVCYEAPMTRRIMPWLRGCAQTALVLLADPGRSYAPKEGVELLTRRQVPVSRELEDKDCREVSLYRVLP